MWPPQGEADRPARPKYRRAFGFLRYTQEADAEAAITAMNNIE